ncbi:MAG: hypothetical protein CJBNEKGG_04341 [Prosthecobacter sp.]|nr:hypothetical protein [Prosthecobacter sp.]
MQGLSRSSEQMPGILSTRSVTNRDAVPSCSPRVPSLRRALPGGNMRSTSTIPDRNAVPSEGRGRWRWYRGPRNRDGTSLRFCGECGRGVSESQGSTRPGSAPLGCMTRPRWGRGEVSKSSRQELGLVIVWKAFVAVWMGRSCDPGTDAWYSIHAIRHEPRRGSVMQPQGAEPSASVPWGQHDIQTHDPGPQRGPVRRTREVETVSWAEEPRRNHVEVLRRMWARGASPRGALAQARHPWAA